MNYSGKTSLVSLLRVSGIVAAVVGAACFAGCGGDSSSPAGTPGTGSGGGAGAADRAGDMIARAFDQRACLIAFQQFCELILRQVSRSSFPDAASSFPNFLTLTGLSSPYQPVQRTTIPLADCEEKTRPCDEIFRLPGVLGFEDVLR